MMIDRLKETINEFSDLIAVIEGVEFFHKETISKLKAKLRLFDGSLLWVREIWCNNKLEAYSYYWLRSDETVIMGWDNAPHHKNVETYPHHKHIKDLVEPSIQTNLNAVLSFIEDFLE
jgi:hypothetical protein